MMTIRYPSGRVGNPRDQGHIRAVEHQVYETRYEGHERRGRDAGAEHRKETRRPTAGSRCRTRKPGNEILIGALLEARFELALDSAVNGGPRDVEEFRKLRA